jgi:hypothetical protein
MSYQSESVKKCQRMKQALLREFKAERGCARCDEHHPACLDFHHRNPEEKHQKLSRRYKHGGLRRGGPRWGDMSYAEILLEVAKCEIVCSNCHRKENSSAWAVEPDARTHSSRSAFLEALRALPR